MSDRVVKVHRGKKGRPRKIRLPRQSSAEATSTPPSLPLAADAEMTLPASDMPDPHIPRDPSARPPSVLRGVIKPNPNSTWWMAPPNSKIRKTAVKILALRLRGMPDAEIATALGLASPSVVRGYIHRAYKNGWLTDDLDNPKDELEYAIGHKLVRNIHQALDSGDPERKDKMTLEVAKGTLFKQFDQQAATSAPALNVLAIKIEMPIGVPGTVREGTMGGSPAYVEGETVGDDGGKG